MEKLRNRDMGAERDRLYAAWRADRPSATPRERRDAWVDCQALVAARVRSERRGD